MKWHQIHIAIYIVLVRIPSADVFYFKTNKCCQQTYILWTFSFFFFFFALKTYTKLSKDWKIMIYLYFFPILLLVLWVLSVSSWCMLMLFGREHFTYGYICWQCLFVVLSQMAPCTRALLLPCWTAGTAPWRCPYSKMSPQSHSAMPSQLQKYMKRWAFFCFGIKLVNLQPRCGTWNLWKLLVFEWNRCYMKLPRCTGNWQKYGRFQRHWKCDNFFYFFNIYISQADKTVMSLLIIKWQGGWAPSWRDVPE